MWKYQQTKNSFIQNKIVTNTKYAWKYGSAFKRCSFDFRSDKFGVFDLVMTMVIGHGYGYGSLHIYTQHTVCSTQSLVCVEMSWKFRSIDRLAYLTSFWPLLQFSNYRIGLPMIMLQQFRLSIIYISILFDDSQMVHWLKEEI